MTQKLHLVFLFNVFRLRVTKRRKDPVLGPPTKDGSEISVLTKKKSIPFKVQPKMGIANKAPHSSLHDLGSCYSSQVLRVK